MAMQKVRSKFFLTEEGARVEAALKEMAKNAQYNTGSSYSPDIEQHPNNLISFVEKHKAYLVSHPRLNADMYLANLRLMTKRR